MNQIAIRSSISTKSSSKRCAVSEISFEIGTGRIHGLLGANGSGKSSVIHGITGLVEFDEGFVDIASHPHASAEAKRRLGFVPDELPLPHSLSGHEYLNLCRRLQPDSDDEWRDFLSDFLGLRADLPKFIGEFSYGMKKKLQLVAALAHRPPLLVLDEPFRGLDADAFVKVLAVLASHREEGGAVLLATHDLALAETECDAVSILARSEIAAQGSPAALVSEFGVGSLAEVFLELSGLADRRRDVQTIIRQHWARNQSEVKA